MTEEFSAPYWSGVAQGVLIVQKCNGCGKIRHYPRVLCDECYSFEWSPAKISDQGAVHSWTVTHHPFGPDLPAPLPYTLVTVDMEAGIRVLGLCRTEDVQMGQPVRLTFETIDNSNTIPVFITN